MKKLLQIVSFSIFIGMNGCNNKNVISNTQSDVQGPSLNSRIRIIVDQNFGDAKKVILPVKSITARILKVTGFEVIDSNNINYTLTLKINIKGRANGAPYLLNGHDIISYEAAEVNGTISFVDSIGQEFGISSFSGSVKPPKETNMMKQDPSQAPFALAFYNSNFFETLAKEIATKYGEKVLYFFWCSILQYHSIENGDEISLLEQQSNAMKALGDLHEVRAIKPLLNNIDSYKILEIADVISHIGMPATDTLLSILQSNQEKIYKKEKKVFEDYKEEFKKACAACALGKLGDKRAIDPLTKALDSDSKLVRLWSAFALYKLGDSQKINIIIAASNYEKFDIQNVSSALGETRDKMAIEPLLTIFQNNHLDYINKDIHDALKKVTGVDLGEDVQNWIKWQEKNKYK